MQPVGVQLRAMSAITISENGLEFCPPSDRRATTWRKVASPVGELLLLSDGAALTGVYYDDARHAPRVPEDAAADDGVLDAAVTQLAEYFSGKRATFSLQVAPRGTEFQRRVWQALAEIPYGATWSYGELAKHVGRPSASRAVGAANGRNPISIIVPCHRVIGADGSLTGYGGGFERKAALLELERRGLRTSP